MVVVVAVAMVRGGGGGGGGVTSLGSLWPTIVFRFSYGKGLYTPKTHPLFRQRVSCPGTTVSRLRV